jgi:HTH-type transcriptional regulator / antitoxin HipB
MATPTSSSPTRSPPAYPVDTPHQLRVILRTLRQSRGLTQAQLGVLIGVSQKRIARIEAAPEVTSFDQVARVVAALGCSLVVQQRKSNPDGDGSSW